MSYTMSCADAGITHLHNIMPVFLLRLTDGLINVSFEDGSDPLITRSVLQVQPVRKHVLGIHDFGHKSISTILGKPKSSTAVTHVNCNSQLNIHGFWCLVIS